MKKTGIVRRVDELGRIVIPKEIRQALEIKIKDPMDIYRWKFHNFEKSRGLLYILWKE